MLANRMVQRVEIVEVVPRDGLQADPADVTTEQKVELISRLIAAGHKRIEAASFVNPKAVPKMADGDAVMAAVPRPDDVSYSAIAFNERGVDGATVVEIAERLAETGLDLDRLIESIAWLEGVLQHSTPGLVAKAGGFPAP